MRKVKIFLTAFPELHSSVIERLPKNVQVDSDLEKVLRQVRAGSVERICIYCDANNCIDIPDNCIRGQGAAERIHNIDPSLPILIMDGREYDPPEFPDIPPVCQVSGILKPATRKEEVYLDFYSLEETALITKKFYEGTLTEAEIPVMEYKEQHFLL